MLKGFKDFIMRGNIVDLAVGVVIGVAFNGMVSQFTASFLQPLINALGGGQGLKSGEWHILGQTFGWAKFVNSVITFVLTAAVLYFLVVLPMNKLAERRARGEEPEPQAPSDEVRLLTEIRDALVAGQGTPRQRALEDGRPQPVPGTGQPGGRH
jgi:large conductance mechanosensitive channel